MSAPTAALLVPDPPVWRSVLVRGLICLAFCLVLALLQAVVVDDWRAPLVGSLSVGGICWLFVDSSRAVLARWRWRRLQRLASDPGPAPDGTYRNWPGWPWMGLLAVAGSCMGVLGGQALMRGLLGRDSGLPPLGPIVLLSVGVTLLISYFFYIREHAALSQKQAEAARRVALETQLRLLQAQLEPHMLFNTLANLRVLIQLDAAKAQAMLDHLIAFLRATLQASRNEWQTLQEEFDQVQDYLALMQVRMGARLQVEIRLDEAVRGVLVPPLLLQPLVENAIVHGLEPQPEGGRLRLTCQRLQERLTATSQSPEQLLASLRGWLAPGQAPPPSPSADAAPLRILQASRGNTIHMVPLEQVLYFEAADKYVRAVTADGEHLLRLPLRELQARLPADVFWQVHRSTLVRAEAIGTVQRHDNGKLMLTLRGHPDRVVVSRLYAHRFKAM